MKTNKILITINKKEDIKKLKELGITGYVFPLKDFCVGFPNTFLISEINEGYVYINRILDNKGIDTLKEIIKDINSNVKGIIFDDLGVLEVIKDLDIEKILYLTHFNTNSKSVNIYLDYVDTVILSTDITKEEIEYIINNCKKEVSLVVFGYISTMYSRRLLLNNYADFYNIDKVNPLEIDNNGSEFIVFENEYGTVFYYKELFNGLELLDLNCKYYFFNSVFLNIEDIKNILNNKFDYLKCSKHFLNKETIYKLKDGE